jgi:ABC-type spermidine/putrescine transport system permease subunit I
MMPAQDPASRTVANRQDSSGVRGDSTGVRKWAWRKANTRHVLLLPTVLLVAVFFLVPLGLTAVYSLGTTSLVTFSTHFGWTLRNYAGLADPLYLGSITRSLLLSAGATLACAVLAVPMAFFIVQQRRGLQMILLLAVIVPFWTSFLIRIYAWISILQNGGWLESILHHLGLVHGPLNWLYTPFSIGLGIVYGYLPLMVLPVYVALERLDPGVLEAAGDLGSHGWNMMWRMVVPLAMPGIIAGCVLVGIPATGEFVTPAILGGGKTLMLGNVMGTQFMDVGNLAFGSAMAMCLVAVVLMLLLVQVLARPRRQA